jgi:hypothetical protein
MLTEELNHGALTLAFWRDVSRCGYPQEHSPRLQLIAFSHSGNGFSYDAGSRKVSRNARRTGEKYQNDPDASLTLIVTMLTLLASVCAAILYFHQLKAMPKSIQHGRHATAGLV